MPPEQLRPIDAAYLALDGPTTTGNVCLLLPLDGRATLRTVRRQVALGVRRRPELRRRLREVAYGLDRPWWVVDDEFDLSHHVYEHTLARSAGRAGMGRLVARISAQQLDRKHPLWAVHLVHDLSTGHSAIVTAVHHAIADGFRMRELLDAFVGPDSVAGTSERDLAADAAQAPRDVELLARSAYDAGKWAVSAGLGAARSAATVPSAAITAAAALPSAPATPFNRAVSAQRSWAFGTLSLQDSRAVRRRLGVTVNDVVHAITAAGLRRWLLERDALPQRPLVALVPMSARHRTDDHSGSNRIALALCEIPTHIGDPIERLQAAAAAMRRVKDRPLLDEAALDAVTRVLAAGLSRATQVAATVRLLDVLRSPINLVISNVPMFDDRFQVGQRTAQAVYPMPPIFEGIGVNITVQGYQRRLDIGVAGCAELVPDVELIWHEMVAEHARLCAG